MNPFDLFRSCPFAMQIVALLGFVALLFVVDSEKTLELSANNAIIIIIIFLTSSLFSSPENLFLQIISRKACVCLVFQCLVHYSSVHIVLSYQAY